MQKVPKKKHLKKRPRWLAPVLIAVAALLCAGGTWLVKSLQTASLPPIDETTSVRTLLHHDESEIVSIEVTPLSGKSYLLLYQDGALMLSGDPTYALRPSLTDSLLACAQDIEVQDTLLDTSEQTVSLSDYGLSPARASAVFTYSDGTRVTQTVGDELPIETPEYYSMLSGDTSLYAVSSDVYDALCTEFSALHPVTNPSIQSDLIDRVTLSGDTDFSAVYTDSGWLMERPFSYPLDSDKMDSFLNSLESLRFSTWIGNADALNLADYGLQTPRLTLTLDFAPSTLTVPDENGTDHTFDIPKSQIAILIGDRFSDTAMYTLYQGQVMTGTFFTFGFIEDFDPSAMYLKNPINFSANNLSFISFESEDEKAEYFVKLVERVQGNNEFETDEYGNTLYDVVAYRDGAQVDSTAFLRWYQTLSQLVPAGSLPDDYRPQGTPYATIVIKNQTGTLARRVDFYPYNAVYQAMTIDGVGLYYIRATWPDTLDGLPK